jgi:signal transduction histidine kinase
MCEIKISLREHALGILIMSSGILLNIFYWWYEILVCKENFYEDFMGDPVAHALVLLTIPIMALIGYQLIQERRLRAKLEETNIRLEDSRKKLERAYEDLKEIDELKSNIIANVSHELRTPITIAKGFIELAMVEEDEEERRNNLQSAVNALIRLNDIVEDLIQVANIERGDSNLRRESFSLAEAVMGAVKEKETLAKEKGVKIEVDLDHGGDIVGDPIKLKRAILNLLDNAIKFNRSGGEVKIKVSEEQGWVKITISDTGIGIPEDRLEDIFKPLTQLDPSPTRRYGGTGTGLAVAKRIIEAHGGKIWVESKLGKGATFYMVLPADNKLKYS